MSQAYPDGFDLDEFAARCEANAAKLRFVYQYIKGFTHKSAKESRDRLTEVGEFLMGPVKQTGQHAPVTKEEMLHSAELEWRTTADPMLKAKLQEQIAGLRGWSLKSKEQPDPPPPEVDQELIDAVLSALQPGVTQCVN